LKRSAKSSGSVSNNHFGLAGAKPGSKLGTNASELGVEVWDEARLLKLPWAPLRDVLGCAGVYLPALAETTAPFTPTLSPVHVGARGCEWRRSAPVNPSPPSQRRGRGQGEGVCALDGRTGLRAPNTGET